MQSYSLSLFLSRFLGNSVSGQYPDALIFQQMSYTNFTLCKVAPSLSVSFLGNSVSGQYPAALTF